MGIVACPSLCYFVDCNYCYNCTHFKTWRQTFAGGGYKEGGECTHAKKIKYVDEYGWPHEIPDREWVKPSGDFLPFEWLREGYKQVIDMIYGRW